MNTSQLSERESVAKTRLESLLDEHAVAKFYDVPVASVRRWTLLRQGPQFLKIGAGVRYRPEDIAAWIEPQMPCHPEGAEVAR